MAATRTANNAKIQYILAASESREVMPWPEIEPGDFMISTIGHSRKAGCAPSAVDKFC
jgi:hypothetical protein